MQKSYFSRHWQQSATAPLAELQMLLAFRARAALQFPAQVTPSHGGLALGCPPRLRCCAIIHELKIPAVSFSPTSPQVAPTGAPAASLRGEQAEG